MLSIHRKGAPLPELTPLPGFEARTMASAPEIARINGITEAEAARRMADGHRAYIGYVQGEPVTYGWVATERADIGELRVEFSLGGGDRYLWDFATLPAWRGRGLYPRLLQEIVRCEEAERFWIIRAPENPASGAGIRKAGFAPVGTLSFLPDGRPALRVLAHDDAAAAAGALLGVAVVSETAMSPCWRCAQGDGGCAMCRAGDHDECGCGQPAA